MKVERGQGGGQGEDVEVKEEGTRRAGRSEAWVDASRGVSVELKGMKGWLSRYCHTSSSSRTNHLLTPPKMRFIRL